MTQQHPRWAEFTNRMAADWFACDHTCDRAFEVLNAMGMDVPGSLEWLHEHGGHCDCEIIMNLCLDEAS